MQLYLSLEYVKEAVLRIVSTCRCVASGILYKKVISIMRCTYILHSIKKPNRTISLSLTAITLQLIKIPAMEELHSSEDTRSGWINYSAFDAKSTHQLYTCLSDQLLETPCSLDPAIGAALGAEVLNMRDFYNSYWKPFGELLTDMEKLGMLVNRCRSTGHFHIGFD